MQKPWAVEVVRCTNEWANGCWDGNESMKEPMHSPLNEPMNPGVIEPMNQRINESTNQQTNDSVNQWANESMYQRINESMNQWINGSTLQWANESLTNESVNQRTNERMNQEISVSMKQATNKSMNQRILPTSSSKSAPVASVFVILTCKLNSRYSLVRAFCRPDLQKCSEHASFTGFQRKLSSRCRLVYILRTSSSKIATCLQQEIAVWSKPSSPCSLVHFLVNNEVPNRRNRDPTWL